MRSTCWWIPSSSEVKRWSDEVKCSLNIFEKYIHNKWCKASFLSSALRCRISLTWGLFSHFNTSTSLTVPRCSWEHSPQVSEPSHVCNEQCNSYKFLSCSYVWHFFFYCFCYRIIFLPSPAFSLSPVSLSGLQGTFGDSTGQPVTHLESVIILNVCKYVQLFSVIDSALLKFCSIKHMLNLLATLYILKLKYC